MRLLILILIHSCGLVDKLHKDLDDEKNKNNKKPVKTYFKDNYKKKMNLKKRTTAVDMIDTSKDGSLWSGVGQKNYFFSNNNNRSLNDIIVIDISKELYGEILSKIDAVTIKEKSNTEEMDKEIKPKKEEKEEKLKETKLTSIIVDKVNETHYVLKGEKEIIYKKNIHLIELQGLVRKKDITFEDTITSNKILEYNVKVLK